VWKTAPPVDRSGTITLHVPITFRRHGGRKTLVAPAHSPAVPSTRSQANAALIKALARAFRWRKQLEKGIFATCEELAQAERINSSYVSRVLRLTLLAPVLVQAILDGQQSSNLSVSALLDDFPVEWDKQREVLSRR
jgi:hypothetical protein